MVSDLRGNGRVNFDPEANRLVYAGEDGTDRRVNDPRASSGPRVPEGSAVKAKAGPSAPSLRDSRWKTLEMT